jgi:hypothetical protein
MRKLLLTAVLSLAAVAGCSKSDSSGTAAAAGAKADDKVPSMTVDEVEKAIAAKEITAVDVNPDTTRKKMGVVPGAILLSDDEGFAPSELPADKAAKLVFYCANSG